MYFIAIIKEKILKQKIKNPFFSDFDYKNKEGIYHI